MKFDIHCHPALMDAPDDYIVRRKKNGTDYLIAAGTAPEDWEITLSLAHKYGFVYPSLGLHPWAVSSMSSDEAESAMRQLKQLAAQNSLVAISECGLDATKPQIDLQVRIFKEHLIIAESLHLPIIVHCVKSFHIFEQLIDKSYCNTLIFHGFSGSKQIQTNLLRKGVYISPGRSMLRRTPPALIDEIHPCCLAETDDDNMHESDFDQILSKLPATTCSLALQLFSGRMSER